jgi:hypothetical protein
MLHRVELLAKGAKLAWALRLAARPERAEIFARSSRLLFKFFTDGTATIHAI